MADVTDGTADLQRIVMVLEYDGRCFHGWQQQEHATSVQQVLQQAIGHIDGRSVQAVAAGRTDAGVHAEAMAVHVDVDRARWLRSRRAYVHGCNAQMPPSVRVIGVREVDHAFHARFDCRGRAYAYRIWTRRTASALEMWKHWWMPRRLDVQAMRDAALHCLGEQDFGALRAAGCQARHAVRRITHVDIERQGHLLQIHVAADAFLYHMVRNLVGNLVEVGTGKRSPDEFLALLQSRDRSLGAATAPAHGLYFSDAIYDDFRASDLIDRM